MREILFRGKWAYGDEWIYGVPVKCYDGDWQIVTNCTKTTVIPETVGQYTGLTDKNGKRVFEGDIVAFDDSDGGYEYQDTVTNIGEVKYSDLSFYFTDRVAVEMDDFYIKNGKCEDIEVIGNTHDNPELLKGGEKNE